jgi:hypothetical protein
MEYFNELFERKNMGQLILVGLFITYLLMGSQTPESLANIIDTMPGKIIVILVALFLFAYSNPILGVLGIFVAYRLLQNASMASTLIINPSLDAYYPTEQKVWSPFTPNNQFPYTLEQEMVKEMAPQKFNLTYDSPSFKPALDDTHDAAPIDYTGPN